MEYPGATVHRSNPINANNSQRVQVRFEPARPRNLVVYRVAPSREVDQLVSWLCRAYPTPRVQRWRRSDLHRAGRPDGTAVNAQLLAKKRWDGVFGQPGLVVAPQLAPIAMAWCRIVKI